MPNPDLLDSKQPASPSNLAISETEKGDSGTGFAAEVVLDELKRVLESSVFRSSRRGSQFLSFVVEYQLTAHREPLKERTIGVALFNRAADYATGDDSVVRAQAREVRRRLERYYVDHPVSQGLRIELPLGSYTPEFTWVEPQSFATGVMQLTVSTEEKTGPGAGTALPESAVPQKSGWLKVMVAAAIVLAVVLGGGVALKLVGPIGPKRTISQFWAPAVTSSRPILICLPKPVLYRPSPILYQRSARWPGEFDREVDRMTQAPHLGPDELVRWSDILRYYDYGISEGDVQAAVRLTSFFGHLDKESEVRIGSGYSTEDLRNSPAVVVGAFSNPSAIEMTSNLYFSFVDDNKGIRIQEQGPSGRSWYTKHGATGEDYGLITRLLDSNTGQFVVSVAGIEASGSDAAADLIVSPSGLENVLHDAPRNWPQKDVQILVSTSVKDSVAGPPKVIAVHVW